MTSTQVTIDQVRIGDTVRIEVAPNYVQGVVQDIDVEAQTIYIAVAWLPTTGATITLIAPAVPPVPTDDGTVIQSTTDPLRLYVRNEGRWVGVRDGDPDLSDPTLWRVATFPSS